MNQNTKVQPSFNPTRERLAEVLPLQSPFSVIIDASDLCNLKCNYCFRANGDAPNREMAWGSKRYMSRELFTRVIGQVREFERPVKKIALSGHGEPLSNRHLPDMVGEIKSCAEFTQTVVEIHTNATLLDRAKADDLARSGIDKVIVSLQGLSAQKYQDVCDYKFCFDNFLDTLTYFHNKTRSSTEVCIKIADVALDEGQEQDFYDLFTPIADRVYIEKTLPLWEEVDFGELVTIAPPSQRKSSYQGVGKNKFGSEVSYVHVCPIMFYTLFVTPVGVVYPCTQALMTYQLGNVQNQTLLEMWKGERRAALLRAHLEYGRHTIADCKKCYVVQNSVLTPEDEIDHARDNIMQRMEAQQLL